MKKNELFKYFKYYWGNRGFSIFLSRRFHIKNPQEFLKILKNPESPIIIFDESYPIFILRLKEKDVQYIKKPFLYSKYNEIVPFIVRMHLIPYKEKMIWIERIKSLFKNKSIEDSESFKEFRGVLEYYSLLKNLEYRRKLRKIDKIILKPEEPIGLVIPKNKKAIKLFNTSYSLGFYSLWRFYSDYKNLYDLIERESSTSNVWDLIFKNVGKLEEKYERIYLAYKKNRFIPYPPEELAYRNIIKGDNDLRLIDWETEDHSTLKWSLYSRLLKNKKYKI